MKIQFDSFKNRQMPVLEIALGRQLLLPAIFLSLFIIGISFLVERNTGDLGLNQQFSSLKQRTQMRELSQKVATLDGESQRLKAFAQKMATLADVDISVFAFDKAAGQGGGDFRSNRNLPNLKRLGNDIEELDQKMLAYSNQLERIQLILKSRVLGGAVSLSEWPVASGYISSNFGWRKDPFTGVLRKHDGIDIAAKRGTPVMSVAAGIVSFVGRNGGYGRVVEVDHGKDVVSRYAHLDSYLVRKGDKVNAGDKIAKIGSSGRSTGPHLHLEIINKKQHVNPIDYLGRNAPLLSVNNK
ncbi:M23 family metallopeptidase [Leucothrix arctica]|uniref:M23 family metallopeptidase n=1 Tax=Leucothrix arctica TaxID=1481894 RepID=UPI0011B2331D|nr:M23 family metallopeptidase [Leucothrix arctica]